MEVKISSLRDEEILAMQTWAYPPPYEMYSFAYMPDEEALAFFKDPENGYFALKSAENDLIGFCNFGYDGRVEGGDYSLVAVDIGIGIRPDLTGKGNGDMFAKFVFEEARRRYPGQTLRVTIAAFNRRAQKVCKKLGFRQTSSFERPSDRKAFLIFCSED